MVFSGHSTHFGDFGVQTRAPNSIKAWLKSPGRSSSTIAFADSLYRNKKKKWQFILIDWLIDWLIYSEWVTQNNPDYQCCCGWFHWENPVGFVFLTAIGYNFKLPPWIFSFFIYFPGNSYFFLKCYYTPPSIFHSTPIVIDIDSLNKEHSLLRFSWKIPLINL